MTAIPSYRSETALGRVLVFDKEIKEGQRNGVVDPDTMRRNIGRHLAYAAEDLQKEWRRRNEPTHYRTSAWTPEYIAEFNRTAEDAAKWDEIDKADYIERRKSYRARARILINKIRWAVFFLQRLESADVLAEIAAGPSSELLHWGRREYLRGLNREVNIEPTLLDNRGRVVAMVTREPQQGRGPTIKALILARPGATTEPPVAWAMHRTRKAAVKWLVEQLHHKWCIKLFGTDVDIPEWRA